MLTTFVAMPGDGYLSSRSAASCPKTRPSSYLSSTQSSIACQAAAKLEITQFPNLLMMFNIVQISAGRRSGAEKMTGVLIAISISMAADRVSSSRRGSARNSAADRSDVRSSSRAIPSFSR
jgi:hypothetical protein